MDYNPILVSKDEETGKELYINGEDSFVWHPPITKGYVGNTDVTWKQGDDIFCIRVYKCHPMSLNSDLVSSIKGCKRLNKPNLQGKWFKGYCYLVDGKIKYEDYT